MDRLLKTIAKLQETQAAIYKIEGGLERERASETVQFTLSSLYKMQRNLEQEFAEITHAEFLDVCEYRFTYESNKRPFLAALTRALSDFQEMFTVVFDAMKNGPKDRASYDPETMREGSFTFAYTFSGSIGFVMTMPNERLLLIDSKLDQAMDFIFKISKAQTAEQIATYTRLVGPAAIRKIYAWAKDHVDASLNADIQWKRQEEVRGHLFIQAPELERLTKTIDMVSDEITEKFTWNGKLVGFDSKAKTFHIEFEKGTPDIKGRLVEGFRSRGEITVDTRYDADILKVTTVRYSTEKEDVSYYLNYLH